MAGRERLYADIDPSVVTRLSTMSVGSQRWLKTALYTIRTAETLAGEPEESPVRPRSAAEEAPPPSPGPAGAPAARAPSLEDVITGEADLREHLEAYPELAEELEGLADIIDMLREAGERRRRRGEQILREEILGEPPAPEDEELT